MPAPRAGQRPRGAGEVDGLVAPATAAIATAAATAAAAAATIAAATATAAAVFPRPGFIDSQCSALHVLAVERLDGRLSLLVAAHFHEAEPLGSSGVSVHDHLGR